jgi:hypothetical protein
VQVRQAHLGETRRVEPTRKLSRLNVIIGWVIFLMALVVIGFALIGPTDDCYLAQKDPVTQECRGRDGP